VSATLRSPAPGTLAVVEALANTRAYAGHIDVLDSLEAVNDWTATLGLRPITASDIASIRRLREEVCLAIEDSRPASIDWLNTRIAQCRIAPTIARDGAGVSFRPPDPDSLEAFVLAAIAGSVADGSWTRMHLCANKSECGVAFYDRSRSRQGKWCSAAVCGNRLNSRAHRQRRAPAASASLEPIDRID
jgi:predicted RNA-binding Zn ribbon-like protein